MSQNLTQEPTCIYSVGTFTVARISSEPGVPGLLPSTVYQWKVPLALENGRVNSTSQSRLAMFRCDRAPRLLGFNRPLHSSFHASSLSSFLMTPFHSRHVFSFTPVRIHEVCILSSSSSYLSVSCRRNRLHVLLEALPSPTPNQPPPPCLPSCLRSSFPLELIVLLLSCLLTQFETGPFSFAYLNSTSFIIFDRFDLPLMLARGRTPRTF